MKFFFKRIGRFFWSWGFLKLVLFTVTLLILVYVEENWRGARAWAATKAEWEAKGETFDLQRLMPPPIPDEQNLAALPLFKWESNPEKNALSQALSRQVHPLPSAGNWQAGHLPDREKIRKGVAGAYSEAFKNAVLPEDSLVQLEALYPFIDDLRTADPMRPYCQFQLNYPPQDLVSMDLRSLLFSLTQQIGVAKILILHAHIAMETQRRDIAFEDVKITLNLSSGLRQEPFTVTTLIAIGMTSISFSSIYEGLALHAWSDAQLAAFQGQLNKADFIAGYQHALRGGICYTVAAYDRFKVDRSELKKIQITEHSKLEKYDLLPDTWPNGWLDLEKAQAVKLDMSAISSVDPNIRRIYPDRVDQSINEMKEEQTHWHAYAPWNMIALASAPQMKSFLLAIGEIQVWVDEARIACGLERYRLMKGVYPETLEELMPTYINGLPNDIFNGQPYHYRLQSDGTFLLYSVGWNQKDEGGKVAYKENGISREAKQGDWTWPVSFHKP